QRPVGVQGRRVVVVAGDRDHLRAGVPQREQRADDELLGVGAGRRRLVQVTGHQHGVDLSLPGDPHDLGQHLALLGQPVVTLEGLADVPVRGVQETHGDSDQNGGGSSAGSRSNGSSTVDPAGGPPRSVCRVAQAGNGNSTASGTGIPGWDTNIAPGVASVALIRCEAGRKPYSGRPASAGSSRPTTLTALLAMTRRSTSDAVCWAPMRMIPSDRPRSAMSSTSSLIGEDPSRGAYLFSSSIIVNSSPPGPAASLRSVSARSTTPTTNRCPRSGSECRSTTVTCWPSVDSPCCAVRGRSARTRGRIGLSDERSRRTNALTVPVPTAGPAHSHRLSSSLTLATTKSTRSSYVRSSVPSTVQAPSMPAGAPWVRSRVATWCTTIVYWLRSSSTSANTYGSS